MQAHLKIWIDYEGKLAISSYRARLLRHIHETGSLARSATLMHLSYRRAWGKVRELEEHLGIALVSSDAGGAGGGRSRLTEAAIELLSNYEAFSEELVAVAAVLQKQYFGKQAATTAEPESSGEGVKHVEPIADDTVDAPPG